MNARPRPLRTTLQRLSLVALALFAACAPIDDEGNIDTDIQGLTGAARRPRLERIRDVAAAAGFTNGVLLAGIAQVETGLSHCWSEATWACRGPNSTSCGGGPVIAGASDGPCSAQQGGLGMFQFDGGTFTQTLARDGRDILTLDGNIRRAVDFVVAIVIREVSGVNTRAEALAWMNGMTVARGDARFERWVTILACRYNGACGSASQAARYRDATLQVQSEVGASFWRICRPSAEVCNGRDDDCDGRVDDGIAAVSCGVGACRRSVTCTGGRIAACTAGRPGAEVCNGIDDDCDGRVDDGIAAVSCGVGACRRTVTCAGGRMAACMPAAARAEVCGNGADDDCDGMTDEGCTADAGAPTRDAGVVTADAGVPVGDAGTRDGGFGGGDVGVAWDGGFSGDDAGAGDDAGLIAEADAGSEDDAGAEDDGGEGPIDESLVDIAPMDDGSCSVGAVGTGRSGRSGWMMAALVLGAVATRRRRR
ncbi:MAG: MopE-related protein [Deltaproteobacteria bacterium]|nr:MopE-related protein [Myxococcales bacterium]MDP3219969.1 MopE-related protein [Deltaproteobacteria bacterium]